MTWLLIGALAGAAVAMFLNYFGPSLVHQGRMVLGNLVDREDDNE